MTKKEIIKKLAEKYIEIYGNGCSYSDYDTDKEDTQIDLLDEIFEEIFDIKDLYVSGKQLMSKSKKIG